jgi:hypothetical protein
MSFSQTFERADPDEGLTGPERFRKNHPWVEAHITRMGGTLDDIVGLMVETAAPHHTMLYLTLRDGVSFYLMNDTTFGEKLFLPSTRREQREAWAEDRRTSNAAKYGPKR